MLLLRRWTSQHSSLFFNSQNFRLHKAITPKSYNKRIFEESLLNYIITITMQFQYTFVFALLTFSSALPTLVSADSNNSTS